MYANTTIIEIGEHIGMLLRLGGDDNVCLHITIDDKVCPTYLTRKELEDLARMFDGGLSTVNILQLPMRGEEEKSGKESKTPVVG